jgi:predicted ATPase/DNA-binding NarL/FixJ family response regulator
LQAQAKHSPVLILQGRCFEPDAALPYAPLLDMLRTFFASRPPDDFAARLGSSAPELVKLLPELAAFLPGLAPSPALDLEPEKRRLFQALAHFFLRLSATHPLLVIVEDGHWSDDISLEFLLYLARRIVSSPILLLLTYRSEEEHPALIHLLAELDRERLATELTLTHLSIDEVRTMVHAIFGQPRAVGADFLEMIYSVTEGNPLFIEEILKSLVTAGEIVYADGRWERKAPKDESSPRYLPLPRSVQLAVQQRLDHLSSEARDLLSLAAVAGRRFDFALLQQLTRWSENELVRLIKELITAQLVVEESDDVFVFRHALTRQSVYTDLLARERKALHRAIAQAMERLYADVIEAHLEDLASHFYAAGEWAKCLEYAQRAGEKARDLYAPHAALEHLTRALEAARHLSIAPPARLYRARGQVYETLGEFEQAQCEYERALDAASKTPDRLAEWQGLLDLGTLWTGRDYTRAGKYLHRALELARTLDDSSILARTLNRLGNWHVNLEQPLEGRQYHEEALAIFQTLSDRRGLAETLDLLAVTSSMGGDVVIALEYYKQAIVLWRALDERQGLASSLAVQPMLGGSYLFSTMVCPTVSQTDCVRAGEEALQLARQIGWRSAEAFALVCLAYSLGPRGEYARALSFAHACLAIAAEVEHKHWLWSAHLALGMLFLDLLALPQAQQHLEQALSFTKETGSLYATWTVTGFLASTYITQKELERADTVLKALLGPETPSQTQAQRLVWSAQAELELSRGHPDRAFEIIERLIASAVHVESRRVIPHLWHLCAQALIELDQEMEAERLLRAAQAMAQEQGTKPIHWRIAITLGKLYQTQDRRNQAKEVFAQARMIIEDLAANLPDAAMRNHFLHAATRQMPRLPQPSPSRVAKQTFGGLTEREREVAALIAQGKSNRALADELVLSERTIAKYIERIMYKLDCSSRAQIAVWAVEKGLVKRPV